MPAPFFSPRPPKMAGMLQRLDAVAKWDGDCLPPVLGDKQLYRTIHQLSGRAESGAANTKLQSE